MVNVGKYTSPMDGTRYGISRNPFCECFIFWFELSLYKTENPHVESILAPPQKKTWKNPRPNTSSVFVSRKKKSGGTGSPFLELIFQAVTFSPQGDSSWVEA